MILFKTFALKLLWSLVSEKFIEWSFFKVAEMAVSHTKTPHDDEWLAKIKEAYHGD